ncbi:MAG: DUF2927 domain-containing protein [Cyclobacteriaceae bacterium]|jgi:hypothetical protein|nr:DUF2927 domain-containing protein [Cyclobacteriaceae bacterium]
MQSQKIQIYCHLIRDMHGTPRHSQVGRWGYVSLLFLIFLAACSEPEEVTPPRLTEYNEQVVAYFKDVALGFEFGSASQITRRWESNMRIFVGGQKDPVLLAELDDVIQELNELATTSFAIERVADTTQSNFYVYLGSGTSYARLFPTVANLVPSNFGLFSVFWDGSNRIFRGHMFVDVVRANATEQKHLLREELTQALGLARDSNRYPDSIFQQAFSTKTTEYAPIDRDLIRLLYHPQMRIGLDRNSVDPVLRTILFAEQSM